MTKKIGYIPVPNARPATPLQTLSSKRNWDRLQVKGSIGQLLHHVYNLPLDSRVKSTRIKQLKELEVQLLTSIDYVWRKAKKAYRNTVMAEFLDYPPKGQ